MSRKSFQRVTLSVELTLPPGAKPAHAPIFLREAMKCKVGKDEDIQAFRALVVEQTIIKIIKRETIYTN